jgi:moderate conductance mechanosensitive channel
VNLEAQVAALLTRLFPIDPGAAPVAARVITIVITVAALFIAYRYILRFLERWLIPRPGEESSPFHLVRSRTLVSLLMNLTHWFFGFVLLVTVLREMGIDVRALLVSAGVVGVAVGLGAQSLVKDVITGFFILFERLIAVGDTVEAGAYRGTVEAIGIRVTKLRLLDGALRVIPNGELTSFTNFSAGWARVIVDVAVSKDIPVDRALEVLQRVGSEWASATGTALETPEAQGIMKFSGDDMVLRLLAKVDPARRSDAEVELRRRIKDAFDRERWRIGASPS